MFLRQVSNAIKNQLKAAKAPYYGLWNEMPPTRGISCLSLVLYGIRIGGFHAGKGSNIDSGVSNIMIPPILDSLSVSTYQMTVSLCEPQTSPVLYSAWESW